MIFKMIIFAVLNIALGFLLHMTLFKTELKNDHTAGVHVITYPRHLIVPNDALFRVVWLHNGNTTIGGRIEFMRDNKKISEVVCINNKNYTYQEQIESILMYFKGAE